MKPVLLSVAAILFACVGPGCGGKSATERSPNESESAQGGRSHGDPDGMTGGSVGRAGNPAIAGSGSGGSAIGGMAGSGGGDVCAAYDDDAPTFVQVLIINQTPAPIHLGQRMVTCGVPPLFSVGDATSGEPLPSLSGCRAACEQLRKDGVGGCAAFCPFPSSTELPPGETLVTMWDGLYRVEGSLPGSCTSFEAPSEQVACDQAKRIEAGTFVFWASAGSAIECTGTTGSACPACTADGNGGCSTPGSLISGKIRIATATVTLDESYGLDAGPAAPNPRPGGLNAAPRVELIFKD